MTKPHGSSDHATNAKRDQALQETFPASDALPPGAGKPAPVPHRPPDATEQDLDESLDESFPASDPPALTDPDHSR